MKFKVGDYVLCTKAVCENERVVGLKGRVVLADGPLLGIDFKKDIGGHDLWQAGQPYCNHGEGWWVSESDIKNLNVKLENK